MAKKICLGRTFIWEKSILQQKILKKACEFWQEALKFNKEQAEQKLQKNCQSI